MRMIKVTGAISDQSALVNLNQVIDTYWDIEHQLTRVWLTENRSMLVQESVDDIAKALNIPSVKELLDKKEWMHEVGDDD